MPKNTYNYPDKAGEEQLSSGKDRFKDNIALLKCPVCSERLQQDGLKSIICVNKHCFNISKKGYVNLLLNSKKSQYNKELFESRNIICENGFFSPLIEAIVVLIERNLMIVNANDIKLLDAGCGEGFHLSQIMNHLQKESHVNFHGVGIDIAKEGIQIAARSYKEMVWCVADLAKIPLMDQQFDVILNILSPSNYREFERILCDEGILIKVVPGSAYLQELRKIFYQDTDKETYSNNKVMEHFRQSFHLVETENVRYDVTMNKEQLKHLIKMTPLSWGATEDKICRALNQNIESVTVDFSVLIGKRKR